MLCPIPLADYPEITLAHGGGGRLMHELIERMFAASFAPASGAARADSAILALPGERLAFTTDSYVVQPLVFPGGDIARLAVFGTCNDLAVCGAEPRYLSVAMVLEEGLPMATLWQLCQSLARAATEAGVAVVTGDTKVVERGKGDGIYLTTSGIGRLRAGLHPDAALVQPGDAVLVSGDIGRHGIAVLAARDEFSIITDLQSDLALLWPAVAGLHAAGIDLHWMRDATRGGLATVLVELAEATGLGVRIDESSVPISPAVAAACELFGFDPLYVANEGCMAIVLPAAQAEAALRVLHDLPGHGAAALIGGMTARGVAPVIARSPAGGQRVLRRLSGEQLPRIC
jgi:hydrogenase expression/formation protein HypE